jgi:translation initiation factor IF-3
MERGITKQRINRQIRAKEVLLIDAEGVNRGIVPIRDALDMAEEAGLDLIEVAENKVPPVCRIADFGKLTYQAKKKKAVSKSATSLKEISFSMKISEHDIDTKLKQARGFVEKGHKLRINLILRGREKSYAQTNGVAQMRNIINRLADCTIVEQQSNSMVGNRLSAILAPSKKVAPVKPAAVKAGEGEKVSGE